MRVPHYTPPPLLTVSQQSCDSDATKAAMEQHMGTDSGFLVSLAGVQGDQGAKSEYKAYMELVEYSM